MGKASVNYDSIKWEDYFTYDESSASCLRWKLPTTGSVSAGDPCLSRDGRDNYIVNLYGKPYRIDKIIYAMMNRGSVLSGQRIIHIDGDNDNNCVGNLVTAEQYKLSQPKKQKRYKYGVKGVAKFSSNGIVQWIGRYEREDGAVSTMSFSEKKYGESVAFSCATIFAQTGKVEAKYIKSNKVCTVKAKQMYL